MGLLPFPFLLSVSDISLRFSVLVISVFEDVRFEHEYESPEAARGLQRWHEEREQRREERRNAPALRRVRW